MDRQNWDSTFRFRFERHEQELHALFLSLYPGDGQAYEPFVEMLRRCYEARPDTMRTLDAKRLASPGWYRGHELVGMLMYVNAFAGTLKGVRENSSGPASAENIFATIENSRDFLAEHLPWIPETDIFDLKKRIRSWVLNERFGQGGCWLIFKNMPNSPDGEFAGAIMMEINLRNHSATLSYWLAKPFTGQGLMTESVKLITRFAFERLKLNRLELLVSVHNGKSAAVAKRCGFTEEGINRDFELINGKFVDHRRFSLLARDVY